VGNRGLSRDKLFLFDLGRNSKNICPLKTKIPRYSGKNRVLGLMRNTFGRQPAGGAALYIKDTEKVNDKLYYDLSTAGKKKQVVAGRYLC